MSSVAEDDTLAQLRARLDAVKRVKPRNEFQGRARAAELIKLENILSDASRQMMDANARKQIADNSNGYNGHATDFYDEFAIALAKGLMDWLKPELGAIKHDVAELQTVVRSLVQSAAQHDD